MVTSVDNLTWIRGDGTTAGSKTVSRMRRFTWLWWMIGAMLLSLLLSSVVKAPRDVLPLSVNNATPTGAMAVAEVLRQQGVSVSQVANLSTAGQKLDDNDTLVIANYGYLSQGQITSILTHPGPIVWFGPNSADVWEIDRGLDLGPSGGTSRLAACEAPAAVKADVITTDEYAPNIDAEAVPGATECFAGSHSEGGAYVVLDRGSWGDVHLLSEPVLLANKNLTTTGNAALAFNVLGASDEVVWYLSTADYSTLSGGSTEEGTEVVPIDAPWFKPAFAAGLATLIFAMLFKGRRMGPLVPETLPVVVRASETTRGRARLYRRGRAAGHASSALRAGAAARMAKRLGLPRTTDSATLISAVAASARTPGGEVTELLYGPPPSSPQGMLDLARRLDALERKVHRT